MSDDGAKGRLSRRQDRTATIAVRAEGLAISAFLRLWAMLGMFVIASAASPMPARAAAPPVDWTSVVRQAIPSVVNIAAETIDIKNGVEQRERRVGSGFLIDPSGLIVTNKHVVDGAFRITITMADRSQSDAVLLAAATVLDIAVLKINVEWPLPFLMFADSDQAEIGEPIILIGNPFGLGTSVSSGIVSAVHRELMNTPIDDYIQTDAALNHGSSGGPMLDQDGKVLGISTILVTESENEGSNGLGFAVSASVAEYTIRHLLHPALGSVGWIGVLVQEVSPPLQSAFHLSQAGGFLVTEVDADSPAARAGLRIGDVITRYDDAEPVTASGFIRQIGRTPPGTTVRLTLERAGTTLTTEVKVDAWKGMKALDAQAATNMARAAAAHSPDLGIILAPLSDAARGFYKIKAAVGVVVGGVDPDCEAFTAGMKAGDVILAVGDQPATSPEQTMGAMLQAKASQQFIALLVTGKEGQPRWVALYSGYQPSAENTQAPQPCSQDKVAGLPGSCSSGAGRATSGRAGSG